jgi:hypothetical protein
LIDRESFSIRSITIWQSEEIMRKNDGRIELRAHLKSFDQYYAEPPTYAYFDVSSCWLAEMPTPFEIKYGETP